ncbi:hypothetical protein HDU67_003547 [Dinochytrium kinnereticum]|nr:hypothetical protein HDU67_003547 [Dinochytrium kinnereticum]
MHKRGLAPKTTKSTQLEDEIMFDMPPASMDLTKMLLPELGWDDGDVDGGAEEVIVGVFSRQQPDFGNSSRRYTIPYHARSRRYWRLGWIKGMLPRCAYG